MARSFLNRAMPQMLLALGPESGEDDFCLLDRFTQFGDERAFEIILERHGPMVWRTCQRIVRQPADAEDVFQATFLVLCRKAGGIRRRESLAGWLCQVAYRIALRVKSRPALRPLDESQLVAPNSDPAAGVVQADLRNFLDESLNRLPEKYRLPLVLCCLEGKTLRRAAAELGWAEGTLATRLARGKELLRAHLMGCNVTLSVAALATFLAQEASARPVPGSLLQASLKLKSLFLLGEVGGTGGSTLKAVVLANGALKAMWLTKFKIAAIAILSVSLLGIGSSAVMNAALARRQAAMAETETAQPAPANFEQPKPVETKQVRTDRHGDPLPAGALVRMGTVRLRHKHPPGQLTTAFSPDGKLLATGGEDDIRLWDLATGKLLREIRDGNRTKSYCSLLFAPDGRWLAGAGRESVCIWDTATGRRLREFPGNTHAVACWPDGKLLLTTSKDGSVSLWNTATGERTAHLRQGHTDSVYLAAFATGGTSLVTLSESNRVCHWNLAEGRLRKTVEMPIPPALCLALSADGQTLAVTSYKERWLSLWDTATGKERVKLQGESARGGFGLAFSADGKILATNATGPFEDPDEITIALWDAKTGDLLRRFRLPTRYVTSLRLAPDGRTLLTTGYEPLVRLWDTATGKPVLQWPAHTDGIQSLAFTPDGLSLVSGSLDRTVRFWEVSSGRQLRELAGHRWRCDVVAVAPDGKAILSGGADGCLRLQDQDGNQLRRFLLDGPPEDRDKPMHHVLALGVTPDGKRAATWSRDPNQGPPVYHLWDLATGKALVNRPDTSSGGSVPQFSPDGMLVLEDLYEERAKAVAPLAGVAGGGGGMPGPTQVGVVLREVATSREILRLRAPEGIGSIGAFAPDGRTLVTHTHPEERTGDSRRYHNALHFWELATRKERLTISCGSWGHWIQRVAYAADGRTLATADSNGTIRLWDLSTGNAIPRLLASDAEVSCLAFSPDSQLLASGHRDGTILVWDSRYAVGRKGRWGGKPDAVQLEQWWLDLASADARRAFVAVCGLSAEPQHAIRLFRDRLHPITEGPPNELRALIADLDSPQFRRREAARKQLTTFDEQAGPALRAALRANLSVEQRRNIEQILDAIQTVRSPEALRHLRAVEVLERIGSSEAQEVLKNLATGMSEARSTQEAQASLKRLARRPTTVP